MRSIFSTTVAGEPISQLCWAQYSGVTSLSATASSCLRNWMTPTLVKSGRKYSRIIRPHPEPVLLVGVGDEDLAHQAPVGPARGAAAAARPLLDRCPMAGDVARVE